MFIHSTRAAQLHHTIKIQMYTRRRRRDRYRWDDVEAQREAGTKAKETNTAKKSARNIQPFKWKISLSKKSPKRIACERKHRNPCNIQHNERFPSTFFSYFSWSHQEENDTSQQSEQCQPKAFQWCVRKFFKAIFHTEKIVLSTTVQCSYLCNAMQFRHAANSRHRSAHDDDARSWITANHSNV